MSYLNQQFGFVSLIPAAQDLSSAATVQTYLCVKPCIVRQVMAQVSTATNSTGNIVVAAKKRVTPGTDTGGATLGSITIPTAIAAGVGYYKSVSPVAFKKGDILAFEVTTAATTAGAAFLFASEVDEDPKIDGEDTTLVASA